MARPRDKPWIQATTTPTAQATLDDLARPPGKAELIGGRIVTFMAAGHRPSRVAARIFQSLDANAAATGQGLASTDHVGFAVPELRSERQSFSPDASYYLGPVPADEMDFLAGPLIFAVEVRSKNDYGRTAEAEQAAQRADYFEAGTGVFWDVDPQAQVIKFYLAGAPDAPILYQPGQTADAKSVVPGWRVAVDRVLT